MPDIFQCENCLRYFARDADGVAFVARPLGVIPEPDVCGGAECAGLMASRLEQERAQVAAEQAPVVAADLGLTREGKPRKTKRHPELHGLPLDERRRRYQFLHRKGLI